MTAINWEKFPDATHFSHKLDDSGMFCDVFWQMADGVALRAWSVENEIPVVRPSMLEGTLERLIARPDPIAVAVAEREEIRAIIEHTKLMGGDLATALHAHGYRKKEAP